jgi:alkylation response protein AidB-like acyl-CoA dehydrogenase
MEFELGEDDRLLVDSVAELGRQHIEPHAAAWDEARALPRELSALLREHGLLALRVPAERGGTGLDALASAAVIETLARADASVALTVAAHNLLGAAVSDAEHLVGWGSATQVQMRREGEDVVIDAMCQHALLPTTAGTIVVAGEGLAFAVPRESSGVIADRDETLGMRAADLGPLRLHTVRLPATAELRPFDADAAVAAMLVGLGAIAVGLSSSALLRARDYALQRQQFGQPIATFQAIQWKLADLATGLDAARLMVRKAAATGDPIAAARAAIKAADVAIRGCSEALQIHGGFGYTREYPLERWLRDARFCGLFANHLTTGRTAIAHAIAARFC